MFIRNNELPAPFLDEFEGGGGSVGAEESEAAEPIEAEETVGAEEPEVAEQVTGKTDADARFAEMRRELEELRSTNKDLEEALGNFFDGETADEKVVAANAFAQGKTEEEIREEIEAENEWNRLTQENEELNSKLIDIETKTRMEHDLQTLQKIDPEIKSLDDLGKDFLDYISSGLDATQAYYAMQAKKAAEQTKPPEEVGKVNQSAGPKDYYTKEEVQGMSQEEVSKNYDAIRKSMSQWV